MIYDRLFACDCVLGIFAEFVGPVDFVSFGVE